MNVSQNFSNMDGGLSSPDFNPNRGMQQFPPTAQGNFQSQAASPQMGTGSWMLTLLILCVPVLNIIMLIVWAAGTPKPGTEARVNFARAYLIWTAIQVALTFILIFFIALLAAAGSATIQ